jgi:RNA-directed DNA polymerase
MGRLLEQIAQYDNLKTAFAKVKANRGAPGINRKSLAALEANLESELASLRRRLLSQERYQPPPVRRVEIAKPDGGLDRWASQP